MRVDAHQHFWEYTTNAVDYVWMTGDYDDLRRDFLPAHLAPLLREAGFDGSIAVQAREKVEETDWLLDLAETTPSILGVVGWVDICAPDAEPLIERYAADGYLKGLRLLIHDRPDVDFAVSPEHVRGIGWLERSGLAYDLLLKPEHLGPATRLVDMYPRQRFVVDHIAKPDIASGQLSPWREEIGELARRPNVYCKVSALVTTADWTSWSATQFAPYLDVVADAFGPSRLMIGSDWPVCTCAASYERTMQVALEWSSRFSPSERADLLGGSCSRFYQLGTSKRLAPQP